LAGTPSGTTFNWTNSNPSIGLISSQSNVTSIPQFTAANSTLEPISSIITVTPSINGCLGDPKNYTITINPLPVVTPISNISVCSGLNINQINLTASSTMTGTGTSFLWSGNNNAAIGLSIPSGTYSPIPTFTAANITNGLQTSTFTVTPTYQTCVGTPINFTIDVAPLSFGGTLSSNGSICSGSTSGLLTVTGFKGAILNWESSTTGGAPWTSIANTAATYQSGGLTQTTYFRVAIQNSGCPQVYSNIIMITVNSLPTITGNLSVCNGATTTLIGSATQASADAWMSTNIGIATISNTGLVTGISPGTTIITYTNSNGCKTTVNFVVNSLPVVFTTNPPAVCFPNTVNLTSTSITTGSTSNLSFSYFTNLATTSGLANPDIISTSGTYFIKGTDANSCSAVSSVSTVVNALPTISISGINSICTNENTTLSASGASSYSWNSGLGTNATINVSPLNTTAYTVNATDNNGCVGTATSTVTVKLLPTVNAGLDRAVCTGLPVTLVGTGTGVASFSWNNAVTNNVSFIPSATTSYTLTGIGTNGCFNTDSILVTVNALPTAPTLNAVQPNCSVSNGIIQFSGLPISGNWTINPGSYNGSGASFTLNNQAPGNYNFAVSDTNLCSSANTPITVNAAPISPAIPTTGAITQPSCATTTGSVVLSGLPTGNWTITKLPGGQTYTNSGNTYTVTNLATGTYTFSVSNGTCNSLLTQNVVIDAAPTQSAPLVGLIIQPTCTTSTGSVTLNSLPTGNWTLTRIPDGLTLTSSGISKAITGLASGTYNYTVTNSNGCISPISNDIIIDNQPASPPTPIAVAQSFLAAANATVSNLQIVSLGTPIWYANSVGGSAISGSTLLATGTYYVSQIVNSCESINRNAVNVTVFPTSSGGSVSGTTTVCSGTNSTILTLSGYTGSIQNWESSTVNDFSSNVITINNLSTTYTATNLIAQLYFRAVVQSGTLAYSSPAFIDVVAQSNGGNLSSSTAICLGQNSGSLSVSGYTGTIIRWEQSINNGSVWSTISNTTSSYNPGNLNVTTKYRVVIQNGVCPAVTSTVATVTVKSTPTITDIPDQNVCYGNTVSFGNPVSTPGYSYEWSSILGIASNPTTSAYSFTVTQSDDYIYTITNSSTGCFVSDSFSITVKPLPNATVISPTSICEGNSIYIGSNSNIGSTYSWTSIPAGFTSTSSNPSVTPAVTTTYVLEETNAAGCKKPSNITITVHPDPTSAITTGPSIICETQINVLLEATISNDYDAIAWEVVPANAGNLNIISDTRVEFTPTAAGISLGTVTVRHTLTNKCGVAQTPVNFPITIQKQAVANAGLSVSTCDSNCVQLNGSGSMNATTYAWTKPTNISGPLTPSNSATPCYTASAEDVANYTGPITFTLEASSGSACLADQATVNVTIIKKPVISAGPATTTICEDTTYAVSGATVDSNTASSSWKTSGDGWFTNEGSLSPTYHPGVTDIATGIVTITLEAIGNTPCSTITSQTVVNITKKPIFNYSNQVVCGAVNTPITIEGSIQNAGKIEWSSTGAGSFDDISIPNPHYTPSPTDMNKTIILHMRVYNQNGCDTSLYTDEYFNFTINAKPIVSAGINETICEGQTYKLDTASSSNASITWSATSGTFNDANEINPTFTPNASDTSVTLTITGTQPGCTTPATDTMVLTIQKKPTVTADNGLPQVICQGDTFYFNASAPDSASVLWQRVSSGSGGILNNPNSISASYVSDTNEAGTVTFSLTANPFPACTNPAITTTNITIIAKPTVSFDVITAADKVICEGLNYVVNSANATNFSSLAWSTNGDGDFISGAATLTPTYEPGTLDKSNGTVILTLKALNNAPCIAFAEDSIELTITKNPIVTVVNTRLDVCTGAGVPVPISGPGVVFGINATNYDGNLNWESSLGHNGFLVQNPLNTTVLNSYTPSASDIDNGSVSLTLTASRLSTNCNILDEKTILLEFIKAPQVDAGPSTVTICENGTYTSTASTSANTASVVWSSNGTAGTIANPTSLNGMVYTPSASDIATGSVTLTLTGVGNSCRGSVTDNIIIQFEKLPVITTVGTAIICKNSPSWTIIRPSVTNNYQPITLANWTSSGTGTFTASGDSLAPIYTPTDADKSSRQVTLTLTVYPVAPCSTSTKIEGTIILDIRPEPVASASVNLNQCETPFTLAATATAGTYSSLNWSTNGNGTFVGGIINSLNPTYTPSATDITNGTVDLTLTANPISPCTVPLATTITVSITTLPDITTSTQATICEDASNVEVLNTTIINAADFVYTSATGTIINNPNTLNPTVTPSTADKLAGEIVLTITATPKVPCDPSAKVIKTITIPVIRNPLVNAGTSQTICEGTNITTANATATFVDIAAGNLLWTNNGGDGSFITSPNNIVATYKPGATEIANGSVNLKLTGTASSPCVNNSVSTLIYTITKKPTLTVIPAIVPICEDAIYKVQPGQLSVTNLSSVANIAWSASSPLTIVTAGTLDLEPTFNPSDADKLNGFSILTVTLTPFAPCTTPITGTIRVNISKKATMNATQANYTFCEGLNKPLSALFANQNPLTYNWEIISGSGTISDNTLSAPDYIPAPDSDAVKIRVSVSGNTPCASVVFKEFTINKIAKPILTLAAPTAAVCSTAPPYSLSATATNTTAATTYQWTKVTPPGTGTFSSPTGLTTSYTFNAADISNGFVTLQLTATSHSNCPLTDSKTITILIDKAPTATITSPILICAGEPYTATTLNPDNNSVSWIEINGNHGTFVNGTLDPATFNQSLNNSSDFEIQLTSNTTAACAAKVVSQMITVQPKPTIDAGAPDQYNCSTQNFVISGVTGTQYDSVLWTIDGTNSSDGFSNKTALNPNFTPTPAQITAGSVVLKITAKAKSPCGTTSDVWDTITLHFTPAQTVSFTAPTAICEGDTILLVGSAPNSSSVAWSTSSKVSTTDFTNPTALNSVYTPSLLDKLLGKVTLTLTGITNSNCPIATESIEILIKKKPTANAGAPVSICQGTVNYIVNDATAANYDPSVLTNINWTLTGPATIASGTQNQLNPTIVPTLGVFGEVVLTLSVTGFTECNITEVSTKTITIVPPPVITIPSTKTICEGTTLALTSTDVSATNSSSVLWTASQGTFSPTNAAATIYTPAAGQTGLVHLNLTANGILGGSCSSVSRTIALTIIPKPVVNAGTDGSICPPGTFTVTGASIQNNYTSYTWGVSGPATIQTGTENSLTPVIETTSGATGTAIVTLTAIANSACPVPVSDNLTVLINPGPIVYAGLDDKLCEGINSFPLNGSVSNASSGTTYVWSTTGSGTIQPTLDPLKPKYIPGGNDFNSSTGVKVIRFDLVANSTNGCAPVTDFMELTIYAKPVVNAGLDLIDVCEGTSRILSGATAQNYSSINWTKSTNASGSGGFGFTSSAVNPTYSLGSADTSSVTLTISALPNAACALTQVAATDAMTIFINKKPSIVASQNETTMCAETFTLPDFVTVSDAGSILWTNTTGAPGISSVPTNATTETPSITPSGDEIAFGYVNLKLTAYPKTGCSGTVETVIKVNLQPKPIISAGSIITNCITASPVILNFGASVVPATTFYWTENGSGTITANATALQPTYTPGPGEIGDITFTLHATNPSPCTGETTATVKLSLIPQPTVNAGTDATVCNGTAYNLLNANATNSSTILWEAFTSIARTNPADGIFTSNNIENPTYTPGTIDKTRGSVYLFMKATNSCSIVDDYMVLTIAPGVGVYAGALASICESTTSYTLQDATDDNATSYLWTSSDNLNGSSSSGYVGGTFNTDSTLKSIYTPSANDVALGHVYLTLKGTGSSTCPIDTSVMKLNITKKPTVSASDIQMCMSNTAGVALNGTGTNYDTLVWSKISGPASGYINSGSYFTGLPSSYPTNEVAQLRLVATPLAGCTINAIKEITINIQSLPIVNAGTNGATCYVPGQPIAPFSIIGSSVANESSSTWTTSSSASGKFNLGNPVIYQSYSNSCSPETLTLTANGKGACSASVVSDAITFAVNCTPPSLGTTTGTSTLCQGTSSVLYTVAIDSNIQTYNWQVPTGATIVSGQGSNSITVDYSANAVSGTVSVNGINGCGTGLPSTLGITVNQRPTTASITGPQTVCAGTSNTYTATAIANADSYKWTLPDGSNITTSILTSANPNTISIPLAVSGNLSVTGYSNNCGLGDASANYAITVVPQPTLTSLAPLPICSNSVFNYTPISSDSGATITWTRAIQGGISNAAGSGNGLISETLLNTTTAVVNVNYVITMTTANGCTKSETISVTVNPIPSLTSGTPPTAICSNGTFSYAPTSDSSGNIKWSRATVPGISEPGANGIITSINTTISDQLTNTTLSPITVSYILTLPANANGCSGPNKVINLIVNPSPNVTPQSAQVMCEGDSLGINFATTNSGGTSSFDWTNTNTIIGLAASGSGAIPTFTVLNPTTINQVATITVTPWFTNGGISCSGTSQTFNITVNPTADVNLPSNQVKCNGSNTDAIAFSTTNTTGTTTYAWTNDNPSIGLIGSGNGTIASFTVTNITTIPQVATIVVTPTYNEGGKSCTGSPKTFTITVNPSANVAQPISPLVCENSLVSSIFTTTNTIGTTTYAWTNSNTTIGLTASTGAGPITPFTALNSGTLPEVATVVVTPTFTYAGEACLGASKTFTITVNPSAQVNPISNITKCKGDLVNAIVFSTANTIGTTTYAWTNSNPSIGLGASGPGDISSFTVSNSGTTIAIATITVTPTFTYNGTSCTGPVQVFTITVNPSAEMIQPVNKVVCNSESTSINFTTANIGGTTTYDWSSDIAIGIPALSGSGSTVNFTATNTGNYPIIATITVTPTFTNGGAICLGLPKTFSITVNPSADVIQPVTPLVLCNGTPTSVNFTTINTVGTTTYSWTNNTPSIGISTTGTGSIATFPITNLGTAPLTANLSVTPTFANAGKTCSGATKNFTITINPTAQLNQPTALVKCIGEITSPIVFTTQNTVGTTTYSWTNDNTSIGLITSGTGDVPSFTTVNTGTNPQVATIVVTPTFTDGGVICTGPTKTFTFTVNPAADVSQPTSLILCNGVQSNVNFATANSGGVTSYSWTNSATSIGLGASSFDSIPTFTVTNTGNTPVVSNLQVTPTFTNAGKSCSGSAKTFTITVNPSAQVDQPIPETVCNGDSTTAVVFSSSYTSGVTTFAWTNSNVSIGLAASGAASIPSFTGINTGNTPQVATIVVTPTYTNAGVSCTGPSKTYTITVNPSAQVNQPTAQVICNGDTYSYNFTSANTGATTSYTWTNNNTAIGLITTNGSGSIPSFTATNSGLVPSVATITVTPTYSNGGVSCVGLPKLFTITVNPSADVIQPVSQVVCNGGSTTSITLSSLNNSGTTSYTWTNSNTSIGLPISGNGALIPSFNAVNTGNIPVVATITVTPTYTNAGVNCAGPSKTFTITVNPTGELNQPTPQVVCNGSATALVNFSSNNSGGATTYSWTNNNTTIGLLSNGSSNILPFNAVNTGITPVVATIVVTPTYTNDGKACSGTPKTFTITVNPSAEVVQPLAATLCNSDTCNAINFSSLNSVGTTTYTWTNSNTSIGLGLNGSGSLPLFTAINNGTSPISSTVVVTPVYTNGGQSCSSSTKTFVITVNPSAEFNQPIPQELCNGTTTTAVNFTTANTDGITTYSWSNSNTTIGLGANGSGTIPTFTVINSGATPQVATITVTANYTNAGKSCTKTKTFTITVNPSPKATITGTNSFTVCQNATEPILTFTGSNATAPYTFSYQINNGLISGLTQTVSTTGTSNSVSVSIPTSTVGNFTIKLLSVKDSSTSLCSNNSTLPNQAFINVEQGGTITPQIPSSVSQTLCEKTPIDPIVFDISGSATNSYVTDLPAGLISSFNPVSKTLTVSGNPTATGVFKYVIHTSGAINGCNTNYTGTLTVNSDDAITLLTPTTANQNICTGVVIKPITYNIGGGAAGGDVIFLPYQPTGLVWSVISNVLTISGVSGNVGTFTYTVNSFGLCKNSSLSGTIVISKNTTVSLVTGNPNTTLCEGTSFTSPIQYAITPSTEILSVIGLPAGVSLIATGLIIGTPTQSGSFPYTISSSTNCGNVLAGTITVIPKQSIVLDSGTTNQLACVNNTIDPIVYTVASGITGVVVNPALPNGITAILNTTTNKLTISGIPTVATSVPQNYSITTQGTCSPAATTTITFDIRPAASINFSSSTTSLNQSKCQNASIEDIIFTLAGGATGIVAPTLPPGLKIKEVGGVYTISGEPTFNGTVIIPITTTGCTITENITISNVNTAVSIDLTSAIGTDNQTLCKTNFNTQLVPIRYFLIGATGIKLDNLPNGVAYTYNPATGELIISGIPTESGVFNYTITTIPCDIVKTGMLKISTQISITNELVTDVTCSSINNGSISVKISGGIATGGLYASHWSGPNGYQQNLTSISGLEAGQYTISGKDAIGCPLPTKTYTALAAQQIKIEPTLKTNVTCTNSLGCANFDITGGSGIFKFTLEYLDPSQGKITIPQNNYFNICKLKAGLYYLTVEDSKNCKTEPYLFTIYDYSTLKIDSISLDTTLCATTPGKVRVTMSSLDSNLTFYYNSTLVTNVNLGNNVFELSIANPTAPSGIIKVINSQNCSDTKSINTSMTDPKFDFTPLNGKISVNESVKFTNGLTALTIPVEYNYIVWDFGDNSPYKVFYNPKDINPNSSGESISTVFHTYTIDGLYPVTLIAYNHFGCSRSITKILTVGQGAAIIVPTAFSPNNDGINDLFRPSLIGLKEVNMYLYDTFGNLIYEFSSNDITSLPTDWGWNGIEKSNSIPVNGTYRYFITSKTINDKIIEKEGQFLLIK
jgi:gliding motility-associated-like protein